jgi:hypothetical protein
MTDTTTNRIIGALLIALCLAADVVLTLKGMHIPAIVSSVLTAALGMLTPAVLKLGGKKVKVAITVGDSNPPKVSINEAKTDPAPPPKNT